jgi:hypothetical protein
MVPGQVDPGQLPMDIEQEELPIDNSSIISTTLIKGQFYA